MTRCYEGINPLKICTQEILRTTDQENHRSDLLNSREEAVLIPSKEDQGGE